MLSGSWSEWKAHQKQNPKVTSQSYWGFLLFCFIICYFIKSYFWIIVICLGVLPGFFIYSYKSLLGYFWWTLGIQLGRVISPVVLFFLYFFILTPWSLLFRIFNPDILKIKANYTSQWHEKEHQFHANDFKFPF
jgi:hypothetical protein